ncbi:hypothetical protein [Burkholderia cenocepacia]|nr:hypothetical protein [Burkholderia cenocepacia]
MGALAGGPNAVISDLSKGGNNEFATAEDGNENLHSEIQPTP